MAMVPKYTSRASVPGSTGMQAIPLSLASSPLSGVGEGITQVAGQLEAAADRVQKREDVISRGRDEDAFKTAVSTEWQRVQDQEDLTDRKTFGTFNAFVNQQKADLLSKHRGSTNSSTLLDAGLTSLAGSYERAAVSATREAQISSLSKQFGDKGNQIIVQVANGTMDTSTAFVEINKFAVGDDTVGGALPTNTRLSLVDALQSQIIITKIEDDLRLGDEAGTARAKERLRQNPHFARILSTSMLVKIEQRIRDRETAAAIADINIAKKLQYAATEMGYPNYAAVPPALKIQHASGWKVQPSKPYEMKSPEGQRAQDRAYLVARNSGSEDSPAVKAFDRQVAAAESAKTLSGAPDIQRLFAARAKLEQDPNLQNDATKRAELKVIKEQIDEKTPSYKREKERAEKFPKVTAAYERFVEQSGLSTKEAKKALMLMTGTKDMKAARRAVVDKEFAITGYGSKIAELRPGSDVNTLKALLLSIGGRVFVDTLGVMKASSPTGSAGVGSVSDIEGQKFTFAKGALDWMAPDATAQTLIGLIDTVDSVTVKQRKALMSAFPTLGVDYFKEININAGRGGVGNGGVVNDPPVADYDLYGKKKDG
jgi:hypothetical protein